MKGRTIMVFLVIILLTVPFELNFFLTGEKADIRSGEHEYPDGNYFSGDRDNEAVTFTKVTDEAGLSGKSSNHFAWGDYNNDGYQDLLMGSKLYRNNGAPGWNFTDVSSAAGISGGGNGVWADYDNDGDLDFYTSGNKLWKNNGAPGYNFTDETYAAGNLTTPDPTMAAGWGDFDRDGDVDLYVVNGERYNDGDPAFYADIFFSNNGDGTFTDRTVQTGLDTTNKKAYGRSVNWGDYNNDGWIDIHVGNYRLCPNYLWRNDRDGTFTDVAAETNTTGDYDDDRYFDQQAKDTYGDGTWGPTYGHTIGSAWGDLDNDGDLDLWDSNLVHKYVGPTNWPNMPYDIRGYVCDDSKVYRNSGAPGFDFTDMRPSSGIAYMPIGGQGKYAGDELWSGVAMGDYDNDGDLDVFVPQIYDLSYAPSLLYRNNDDGTFTQVANALGLESFNHYGGSWCDYDNDGDLDLISGGKKPFSDGTYEAHLFRNNGNSNHYLHVDLVGTENNKIGLGARVKITSEGESQIREVEGGMGSHGHQNSITVEFGLGSKATIDEVEVTWPDGKTQLIRNPAIDQTLEITESDKAPSITGVTVSETDVDEDEKITFGGSATDPDGTISKYEWDFEGDGVYDYSSPNSATVQHGYPKHGEYFAKLRVWDNTGLLGDAESTIYISVNNLLPVAQIAGDTVGIEEQSFHFTGADSSDTANDLGNLSYYLNFGDGNDTGWVNFTEYDHIYPDMGSYTVRLIVKDDEGETSSDTLRVTVKNMVPAPQIFGIEEGVEDTAITFNASCNDTLGDLDLIKYAWDFGDDDDTDFSDENTTSHTYIESGIYTVTLRVKDRHNTINSTTHILNISNVLPRCTSLEKMVGDEDEPVSFYGDGFDTPSDADTLQYQWDFGDGTRSIWLDTSLINHIYTQAGNYTAVLTVEDDDGDTGQCYVNVSIRNIIPSLDLKISTDNIYEDDIVKFTGSGGDSDSDEDDLLFRINFGDGNETGWQSEVDFTHSYNFSGQYDVIMEIMDNSNDTTQVSRQIVVINMAPTASFGHSPKRDLDEMTVINFDASASMDTLSDRGRLNYTWKMGARKTLYGKKVANTFLSSGKQVVKLTVRDDDGHTGSTSQTLTIENIDPVALIDHLSSKVKVGESVEFDASGSTDTPGDMEGLEYEWRIGSLKKYGMKIQHSFDTPNTYKVYLTVTDEDGGFDENYVIITVTDDSTEKPNESGGSTSWIIVGVIIIIILVASALVMILLRKKKKPETEPTLPDEDMNFAYQGEENAEPPAVPSIPLTDEAIPTQAAAPICTGCGQSSEYYPVYDCYWCEPCQEYVYPVESSEVAVNEDSLWNPSPVTLPGAQEKLPVTSMGGATEPLKALPEPRLDSLDGLDPDVDEEVKEESEVQNKQEDVIDTTENEKIPVPQQDEKPVGEAPAKIIRKKVVRKVVKKNMNSQ